jgi:hypothetical protein
MAQWIVNNQSGRFYKPRFLLAKLITCVQVFHVNGSFEPVNINSSTLPLEMLQRDKLSDYL